MSEEDDDIFLKHVKDVLPLKSKNTVKKPIKKTPKDLFKKKIEKKPNKEIAEETKNKKTRYFIENNKTKKLLKKGKMPIDKKIDLHGKTLQEAENEFIKVIKKNYYENRRCLLFITGKGLSSKQNQDEHNQINKPKLYYGKIREAFIGWANKTELSKFILTYERAHIEHGGDGAFYIYLRKNKSN